MSESNPPLPIPIDPGNPIVVDAPVPAPVQYDASSIVALEGLEAVRKRPGMYIGDVHDGSGLHHLVWEAVDNSVDEHLAGHCKEIHVTVEADGSVTVEDDGRGIPVGQHARGVSAAEVVMTVLHAGGKFDNASYKVSAGLHGVGVSAVNACSETLTLEIKRDGRYWRQKYGRGAPKTPLEPGEATTETGTRITFKPDHEIFSVLDFSYDILATRLRELAFLNAGLTIHLADERTGMKETFLFRGGIREFVQHLGTSKTPIHTDVIHLTAEGETSIDGKTAPVQVEVAMQWTSAYHEAIFCYTNNVKNREGGTHLTGLRAALTKCINAYGTKENLFREFKAGLSGEDTREGLTCVLSVKHPDPSFDSQTKSKLVSSEVKGIVETAVNDRLSQYFEEHPEVARSILAKAIHAAKVREAARKAREKVRKETLDITSLSGKLASCQSKDPTEAELYIVEGESAGGSAKMGRDRRFQAILPLKGKILNVERVTTDRMLGSAEVGTLITALGCGVSGAGGLDLDKLRYHKVILMTDADVDGAHIRTLLLTFFYRQMREVIERGFLYIAQPPLYRVTRGKKDLYLKDDAALDTFLTEHAIEKLELQPEKGGMTLAGQPLLRLASRLKRFKSVLANLDKRCDARVAAGLLRSSALASDDLRAPAKLEAAAVALRAYLESHYDDMLPLTIAVDVDSESGIGRISVTTQGQIRIRTSLLDARLLESPEYREALSIQTDLRTIGEPPYVARGPEGETVLAGPEALGEFLEHRGRKGITVSRYKGLGEMNADELWETTMNPDARVLRQVRIDDALSGDELFSILMGDEVEPRRAFIEQHALLAQNLDI